MNNHGQFYLIAAVVIIGVLLTFTAVTNTVKKVPLDKTRIYNLFNEMSLEDEKILDYDYVSSNDLTDNLIRFVEDYEVYLQGNEVIYFIVGKNQEVIAFSYNYNDLTIIPLNNEIKLSINGTDYEFEKKTGNYYYIVFKEKNSEQYVVSG